MQRIARSIKGIGVFEELRRFAAWEGKKREYGYKKGYSFVGGIEGVQVGCADSGSRASNAR